MAAFSSPEAQAKLKLNRLFNQELNIIFRQLLTTELYVRECNRLGVGAGDYKVAMAELWSLMDLQRSYFLDAQKYLYDYIFIRYFALRTCIVDLQAYVDGVVDSLEAAAAPGRGGAAVRADPRGDSGEATSA